MKTRTKVSIALVGSMVLVGGCAVVEDRIATDDGRDRIRLELSDANDSLRFKYLCRAPSGHDDELPHLEIGDALFFGESYGQAYLIPGRTLKAKGWGEQSDGVIELEYHPGERRTTFYSGCNLEQAAKDKGLWAGLSAAERRRLQDFDRDATGVEDHEYWFGTIGSNIVHDSEETRTRDCHDIRLQVFEVPEADLPGLRGIHFVMEIERCGHIWDGKQGVKQAQLGHGGVYHGGND